MKVKIDSSGARREIGKGHDCLLACSHRAVVVLDPRIVRQTQPRRGLGRRRCPNGLDKLSMLEGLETVRRKRQSLDPRERALAYSEWLERVLA